MSCALVAVLCLLVIATSLGNAGGHSIPGKLRTCSSLLMIAYKPPTLFDINFGLA